MATRNEQKEQEYKTRERTFVDGVLLETTTKPKGEQKMKFSIIFPTRERTQLVTNLLRSIRQTTANIQEIEVLIAVDTDDTRSFDCIRHLCCPFVKVYQVPRSLNFSRDYYSFLARQSSGQWIITANDDCVFETPNWDVLAYDVLKDKPGVIYGWIQDGIEGYRAQGHGNYCCFPLQGRAGYEALGYIFPSRVPTWGADIWAKNLYDQVDSVVELPITLMHYCHHNKTRDQDEISKRIAMNQVPFDMRPNYDEVNKLLAALRKEMSKV